jgi:carboxyl-terminal processing protease
MLERLSTLVIISVFLISHVNTQQVQNATITPALSETEKIYGLSLIWQEVNYNFAFFDQVPELDWDAAYREYIPKVIEAKSTYEYYRLLQSFTALLQDGHTDVYLPPDTRDLIGRPRVQLRNIDNRAYVMNVGSSLEKMIPVGSEIIKIDNISTDQYLQEHIFPYLASSTDYIIWNRGVERMLEGLKHSPLTVTIRTQDGAVRDIDLQRIDNSFDEGWVLPHISKRELLDYRILDESIAYVALNSFENWKIVEMFDSVYADIQHARGLIIDLRYNGGGSSDIGYAIINHLTDTPYKTSMWKTREHRAAHKAWGYWTKQRLNNMTVDDLSSLTTEQREWMDQVINYYNGTVWYHGEPRTVKSEESNIYSAPIVVLVGNNTASAAEDFLVAMDMLERATFVGARSFGSTGQPLMLDLPGGGGARVCTKRDTYPDGREFVGYGITPHVEIKPDINDVLENRDVVLEKGIAVLLEKL